jgi:hypothetical protein
MTTRVAEENEVSRMLIDRWEQIGAKLVRLGNAFPEEKYETPPVACVRTFGGVLRHVAFWNLYVAGVAPGDKPDDSTNELPKATYSTKAQVIVALGKSAADAAEALRRSSLASTPHTQPWRKASSSTPASTTANSWYTPDGRE